MKPTVDPHEVKVEFIDTLHRLFEATLPLLIAEAVLGHHHPVYIISVGGLLIVTNLRLAGGKALFEFVIVWVQMKTGMIHIYDLDGDGIDDRLQVKPAHPLEHPIPHHTDVGYEGYDEVPVGMMLAAMHDEEETTEVKRVG